MEISEDKSKEIADKITKGTETAEEFSLFLGIDTNAPIDAEFGDIKELRTYLSEHLPIEAVEEIIKETEEYRYGFISNSCKHNYNIAEKYKEENQKLLPNKGKKISLLQGEPMTRRQIEYIKNEFSRLNLFFGELKQWTNLFCEDIKLMQSIKANTKADVYTFIYLMEDKKIISRKTGIWKRLEQVKAFEVLGETVTAEQYKRGLFEVPASKNTEQIKNVITHISIYK